MKKLRFRRWSPLTISMLGGIGLFLFGVIPSPHGPARAVEICIAVILVGATFVGPDLARRNAEEEARLAVEFQLDPPLDKIPSYEDVGNAVDSWVATEREACLERLKPAPKAEPQRKVFTVDAAGDGPSIAEMMEYERREQSGETLTPEEAKILIESRASLASTLKSLSFAVNMFSEPDKRSEEDYRQEVESYLKSCRKVIEQSTEHAYRDSGMGRFQIRLRNPSDRTYEKVQVEVTIDGTVWAKLGKDSEESSDPLPSRPRTFGQRRPFDTNLGSMGMISPGSFGPLWHQSDDPLGPTITNSNSNSTSIKYLPVTLRAKGSVLLEGVHLFTASPVGTILKGTWEATSTSADGRVSGEFELIVSEPIRRTAIIASLLENEDQQKLRDVAES